MPKTKIILGGNLGASAEILLKFTGVDYVAIGEGEKVIVGFADCFIKKGNFNDVPSLAFLNKKGQLTNTGYGKPLGKDEIYDIDWGILERYSNIENFCSCNKVCTCRILFLSSPKALEKHRKNKTLGTLVASKGCVARCTFCHRWDKGIRYIPIPILKKRITEIVDKYNVGFCLLEMKILAVPTSG